MNSLRSFQLGIEIHGIIFSVILMVLLFLEKAYRQRQGLILMQVVGVDALVLLSDMLAAILGGPAFIQWHILHVASNYLLYGSQFILVAQLAVYVYCFLLDRTGVCSKKWTRFVGVLMGIDMIGLCLNPWFHCYFYFDENNYYYRGTFFLVSMGLGAIGLLSILGELVYYKKNLSHRTNMNLTLVSLPPIIGILLQMFVEGFSFMNVGAAVSVFMVVAGYIIDWEQKNRQREKILVQSRAYLLNSQIQPHFVFNALNTIQALIEEEPETAEEAIRHFSKFLRKSMDLKMNESLISVWEELDYVKNYVYLEQLRFGEKLKIVFDLDENLDFQIPFLSVQPLVENAIRHGVRKKAAGGTVTIRVHKTENDYTIVVSDDGAGCEQGKLLAPAADQSKSGVGLRNVEERIMLLCQGKMEFQSQPQKGTIITIHIPFASRILNLYTAGR